MDPRIERAARALCEMDGVEATGESWDAAMKEAERFLRVLDAVTPKPAPDVTHLRRGPARARTVVRSSYMD